MTCRPAKHSDIGTLREMHESSGLIYEFPDLHGPKIEGVMVIVDEYDRPLCAGATERILQTYFWCGDLHPAAKLRAIRMLHEAFATLLHQKGYTETNCFVPPSMVKTFGRRLMRTFGWVPNWPSFARRF